MKISNHLSQLNPDSESAKAPPSKTKYYQQEPVIAPDLRPLNYKECFVERNAGDPKLSVSPKGKLILFSSSASLGGAKKQPISWRYNQHLESWSKSPPLMFPVNKNDWFWGLSWDKKSKIGYGVTYRYHIDEANTKSIKPFLFSSVDDGQSFLPVSEKPITNEGSETAITNLKDGSLLALIRSNSDVHNPKFELINLGIDGQKIKSNVFTDHTIGGQSLLNISLDGNDYILSSYRVAAFNENDLYEQKIILSLINPNSMSITKLATIATNGADMGYTGMVFNEDNGELLVSYYNSDISRSEFLNNPQEKPNAASIYLAKLLISEFSPGKIKADLISSKRVVKSNGEHNAFTSMIHYKGKYYLAYRKAQSHYVLTTKKKVESYSDRVRESCKTPGGVFHVLSSNNGETWTQNAVLKANNVGDLEEEAPEILLTLPII
jgi:hypothetical protein